MKNIYGESHIAACAVFIFFCMIACGALYVNLFACDNTLFLSEFSVHEKNVSVLIDMEWKAVFSQIFAMRMMQLLCIAAVICFLGAKWIFYILAGLMGMILGIVIAVETMMLGACGMLYGVVIWIPQGIFYGTIYYMLYIQIKKGNMTYPSWSRTGPGISFRGNFTPNMRRQFTGVLMKAVLAVALIALGSLVEAYINPRLILFCNQHIVSEIFL